MTVDDQGRLMTVDDQERRQVWLAFASAITASESKMDGWELVEFAVEMADVMLDVYLERFEPGHVASYPKDPPPPRKKKRPRR
jgi:hypothetical protein